jgi:hypothetical protein
MNNLYIKHPSGYCYLSKNNKELYFLSFINYFIEKKMITDENIIAQCDEIKKLCHYNNVLKVFMFNYIDYWVEAQKSIRNNNNNITFEHVEKNYHNLVKCHELSTSLISHLKTMDKEIKAITNLEFDAYLDSKEARGAFFDKKERYFFDKLNNEDTLNYWEKNKKVGELLSVVKQEYPNMTVMKTQTDFKSALKFNLQELVDKWEMVLSKQGRILQTETNSATDHFKKSLSYAIFCEVGSNTGYFQQKLWGSLKISALNNAKIFTSIDEAKDEMKKNSLKGAIVAIDVNFKEIVHQVGKINLSDLETVVAYHEKEMLEDKKDAKTLAKELLALISDNENLSSLNEELEKMVNTELVEPKKIKRKI